jgi:hypothetical protein
VSFDIIIPNLCAYTPIWRLLYESGRVSREVPPEYILDFFYIFISFDCSMRMWLDQSAARQSTQPKTLQLSLRACGYCCPMDI